MKKKILFFRKRIFNLSLFLLDYKIIKLTIFLVVVFYICSRDLFHVPLNSISFFFFNWEERQIQGRKILYTLSCHVKLSLKLRYYIFFNNLNNIFSVLHQELTSSSTLARGSNKTMNYNFKIRHAWFSIRGRVLFVFWCFIYVNLIFNQV